MSDTPIFLLIPKLAAGEIDILSWFMLSYLCQGIIARSSFISFDMYSCFAIRRNGTMSGFGILFGKT